MKKAFNVVVKFVGNLLNFSMPEFIWVDYTDCIINRQSYLLLEWNAKNTCSLKIKSAHYISHNFNGSAYIAIPGEIDEIEIKLSNFWRSTNQIIFLNKHEITCMTDFNPKINFENYNKTKIEIPNPALKTPKILLNPLNIKVLSIDGLKEIINITYP